MDYLLTYDVGSTGCKAAIVTIDGRLLETAHETYPTYYPQPLWAEQDPETWWYHCKLATAQILKVAKHELSEVKDPCEAFFECKSSA